MHFTFTITTLIRAQRFAPSIDTTKVRWLPLRKIRQLSLHSPRRREYLQVKSKEGEGEEETKAKGAIREALQKDEEFLAAAIRDRIWDVRNGGMETSAIHFSLRTN